MPVCSPEISVILPFYKNGAELNTAISSIAGQSFTGWELLLVNNNAGDEASRIAEKWATNDQRIKILHEPTQGIAFALNTGLKHASCELIARMDADDQSHPERLAIQLDFLKQHPGVDVVATQTEFSSELPKSEGYEMFTQWQNSLISAEEHMLNRFVESPLAHPTVMFRKKLIAQFGFYDTGNVPEDYELWLRWMDRGVRFHKIPAPLVQWNDHIERLSRTNDNYSKEAFFTVKCKYMAAWIKKEINPHKKIVICGSSKIIRKRADLLAGFGVDIFAYTDVKPSRNRNINFIPYPQLTDPEKWLIINFISKRGVGKAIRTHFQKLGFADGRDFIAGG